MFLISLILAATIATKADIPRLTPQELRPLIESGDAIAIDVRGSVPYSLGRIEGATWLPLGLIGERAGQLPKEKLIVAYCTCGAEELSLEAALTLATHHGIERVAVLKGGYPAWKEAGYAIAADPDPDAPPPTAPTETAAGAGAPEADSLPRPPSPATAIGSPPTPAR